MLNNQNDLCAAIHARFDGCAYEDLGHMKTDPGVVYLSRLTRRYFAARDAAAKFGWIGVGEITFAEHRMRVFQRRALHMRPDTLSIPCSADKPARIKLTRGGF